MATENAAGQEPAEEVELVTGQDSGDSENHVDTVDEVSSTEGEQVNADKVDETEDEVTNDDDSIDDESSDDEDDEEKNPGDSDESKVKASEVKKLRRESARYRTERNEAREQIETLTKDLDSEREKISVLTKERDEAIMSLTKSKISSETGVPVDLLPEGDEEEIRARAETLRDWKGTSSQGTVYVESVGKNTGGVSKEEIAREFMLGSLR